MQPTPAPVLAQAATPRLTDGTPDVDPFGFLRANPQFQLLRKIVHQQPHMLPVFNQKLSKLDPYLAELTNRKPFAFNQLLSEDHDENVKGLKAHQDANPKPVPRDPDLSIYKQIADKLSANPDFEAGHNSADQTGYAFNAHLVAPDGDVDIQPRVANITELQRATYAQMGLMKVLRLDNAELTTVRENPEAVKEFLGARLNRLVDVQNADVRELVGELQRLMERPSGVKMSVDMWKLFGWDDLAGEAQMET